MVMRCLSGIKHYEPDKQAGIICNDMTKLLLQGLCPLTKETSSHEMKITNYYYLINNIYC